jgi:hypothetical protein
MTYAGGLDDGLAHQVAIAKLVERPQLFVNVHWYDFIYMALRFYSGWVVSGRYNRCATGRTYVKRSRVNGRSVVNVKPVSHQLRALNEALY